jgi:hypothetical protein
MKEAPEYPQLMLDSKGAAAACSTSLSLWARLDAEGATPAAVKLHSKRMYSVELLKLWARNGCPHRSSDRWQALLRRLRNE